MLWGSSPERGAALFHAELESHDDLLELDLTAPGPRFDLPLLLGTTITVNRKKARAIGYGFHFMLGPVFALGYGAAVALGESGTTSLFMGAALTATSVGVTARVFGDRLHLVERRRQVWGLTARSKEQIFALDLLMDPDVSVVALSGRASRSSASSRDFASSTPRSRASAMSLRASGK